MNKPAHARNACMMCSHARRACAATYRTATSMHACEKRDVPAYLRTSSQAKHICIHIETTHTHACLQKACRGTYCGTSRAHSYEQTCPRAERMHTKQRAEAPTLAQAERIQINKPAHTRNATMCLHTSQAYCATYRTVTSMQACEK